MSSLQVYVSRGNQYARIVESYRDPITKKPTSVQGHFVICYLALVIQRYLESILC